MTEISYHPALRQQWPRSLAGQWRRQSPLLFDKDDVRLTKRQPNNHFAEWFAAIHLFQRDGVLSLVEKYIFTTHPGKLRRMREIQPGLLETLRIIKSDLKVQPPDLLLYSPHGGLRGFAEAKGIPGDRPRLSAKQLQSHRLITEQLNVPVETLIVRPLPEAG